MVKQIVILTNEQKELLNFNKHLLLKFFPENSNETEEITILSLSKKIGLSYRATYKRVLKLIESKILLSEQDDESRGRPIVLNKSQI
jgi:hypothetical protein